MPRQEGGHQRRQVAPAEPGRRGDAQMAAGLDAASRDAGLGVVDVDQQALAVLQEGAALVGEADAAGGAQQQLDAQPRLQRVHAPPDDGRRHALCQCGGGQAALGGRGHEGLHLLQAIHRSTRVDLCEKVTNPSHWASAMRLRVSNKFSQWNSTRPQPAHGARLLPFLSTRFAPP
jgi:hypothetical protein